MLNCVYGAVGSGKTEYIYDKIRQNQENELKSFVLVPEQSSMDTERKIIEELGLSSQLYVEVLTFSRLCNLVFSQVGPLRLKYIDKAGKLFVIQKTMQTIEKELSYYGRNVHQRGFAQTVANLISELKRYGVTAEALRDASSKAQGEEFSRKISDISLIYQEYDRLITDKYSDAEENLLKAIPGIAESGLFSGEVFISGFKSFTPVEHLAISELLKILDITVVLTTDSLEREDSIFASATKTWQKLKNDATLVGAKLGETKYFEKEVKFEGNFELSHLKNNYFAYPYNIHKEETHNISLVFAKESYDEVRKCAQIIAGLCRKENYRYGDFLILARNTENYFGTIRSVFEEYGISCFINDKKQLSKNPFVRKVLALTEILAYGFSYERIMPIVKFGNENYTRDEADVFENYVLAANISHKYWNSEKDWEYNPDEKRISLETVNKVKGYTVNSILEIAKEIKGRKTVSRICRAVLKWIEKQRLNKVMEKEVDRFNEKGLYSVALEYTRAWNAFSSVISQMETCMGEEYITYEMFYEMLRGACDEVTLSITPQMQDQVTVGEIDTFRKSDARVVIVLGLIDGVFPKGYIEDGMLSDAERDVLSDLGIELAPTAGFKRSEEQNLIYNVLTAPKEKLYLVVPMGDKEGKATVRSGIVDRVLELFPSINQIWENSEVADSPKVIFKSLLTAIAKAKGDIEKLSEQNRKIYDWFIKDEELKAELKEFENSARNYNPEEKLTYERARELYGKKLMVSISKLEKYNACAFSYFMKYGLMANKRLVAGFEANDTGSILHEILQIYFEELKEKDTDYSLITLNDCKKRIIEISCKAAKDRDELLYETSPYYRYVAFRLTSVATATAWEIVKFYANSCFRPYGFEIKIGNDGVFVADDIELDGAVAQITGFIDRIDMAEIDGKKYVNIVDYKSSEKDTSEDLEELGVRIQPLVYSGVACANLGAYPSGMIYIHMNEPMLNFTEEPDEDTIDKERQKHISIKGVVLDEGDMLVRMDSRTLDKNGYIPSGKSSGLSLSQMEERISKAKAKVKETAEKIISGDIRVNPCNTKGFDPCEYCEYAKVCGGTPKKE